MYRSGYILRTTTDFKAAIAFQKHIEVWQQGRLIDYGGQIESHSELSVTINGAKYLKPNCEFKVR